MPNIPFHSVLHDNEAKIDIHILDLNESCHCRNDFQPQVPLNHVVVSIFESPYEGLPSPKDCVLGLIGV